MKIDLDKLVRPNIRRLMPYSCARDEYKGKEARVFLDANENPYNSPYNRYPDPLQWDVKQRLAQIKGVRPEQIFLGNGSDEAIDLVYRVFCRPGIDNVVAIAPTYGMYKVCADINDVEYRPVALNEDFSLDAERLLAVCDPNTKAVWLCTPNNPVGNCLQNEEIKKVIDAFPGIVVIDEAYGDFAKTIPFRNQLDKYPNILVLNTMSKAWGSAAIRLGMAFASEDIIELMNRVKYPYNVNLLTQRQALEVMADLGKVNDWLRMILCEREKMLPAFAELSICKKIYPTDANFFLARVTDANGIYKYLIDCGIVVRNRNSVQLCEGCLRITIGSPRENNELLKALRQYK